MRIDLAIAAAIGILVGLLAVGLGALLMWWGGRRRRK